MIRIEKVRVDAAMAGTIAGLVNQAFKVETFVDGDRIAPEAVGRLAESTAAAFFVAFDDETPIGTVYTEVRAQGRGYFGLLAVDGVRQGAGLGHRLVSHAEDYLRDRGCDTIEITVVDRRTDLFPYYEKRGYRVDGRTLPFPREAKEPCVLVYMSRTLPPVPV